MRRSFATLALLIALAAPAAAAGRITINARDADLADVIRLIGIQSRLNIIADGTIKPQKITLRLRNVDPDVALATLARAYNLETRRDGNIVIVGDAAVMNRRYADGSGPGSPQTEIFALTRARPDEVVKELLEALPAGTVAVADKRTSSVIVTGNEESVARARRLVTALDVPAYGAGAMLSSVTIPLKNGKPSETVKALRGAVPEGAAVPDDRSNSVIVTGSADTIATARSLLQGLDAPGRQVMFEVRVADVKPVDDSSNVGVEFGGLTFGTGGLAQFPYTLTKSSVTVNAQINLLVQHGRAQILATPRIATVNNREASLLVGEQYPVVTVNQQTGFPSVQTIDIGVRLRLTPTIADDGTITAELHPEFSQIIGFNASFPIIANRKVDSTVRVRDGETIVLGGLFQEFSSETITKLPFLGDLPGLGVFFRNKQKNAQRDEVVFFITPRIVDPSP